MKYFLPIMMSLLLVVGCCSLVPNMEKPMDRLALIDIS